MPSKQVEDVYNAGGFDDGPLRRRGFSKLSARPIQHDLDDAASTAWNQALELAAIVAERRIKANRADGIPAALRNLIVR